MTNVNVIERTALVRNFVENNPNPNPEMVPVTILKWETTEGKILYRTDIGKVYVNTNVNSLFEEDEELILKVKKIWSRKAYELIPFNTRKEIKYLYINRNKEHDFIEIGEVAISGNRAKDGEVRTAHFTDYPRLFMFRNDLNLYTKDGVAFSNKTSLGKYLQPLLRLNWCIKADLAIQDFLGQTTLPDSYRTEYEVTPYSLEKVYAMVSPKKPSKKAQQIEKINSCIDKLTPIEKIIEDCDLNNADRYSKIKDKWTAYTHLTCGYYFDDIGDGWFALRQIIVRFNIIEKISVDLPWYTKKVVKYLDTQGEKEFFESVRVYINDKGECSIAEKVGDEFKVISSNTSLLRRGYVDPKDYKIKVFNFDEMGKCARIKYVLPLIEEENNQGLSLVNILRHPVLEQLCKAGYTDIAKVLTVDNNVAKNIENYFGVKEKKTGALFKNLNVNKHIMNKIQSEMSSYKNGLMENYYYNHNYPYGGNILYAIKNLQELFDGKFNDLTPAQINLYIEAFIGLSNAYGTDRYLKSLRRIHVREVAAYNYWRTPTFSDVNIGTATTDIIREEKEDLKKLLKHGGNNEEFFRAYCDLLRSYSNIQDVNNRPGLEGLYDIKSLQEMIRLHDIVVEYARIDDEARMAQYRQDNKEREQQKMKKFQSLQKERIEKFEDADSNEKYGVYVPKALTEIVKEGNDLRHCVGGYVDKHALGETNILFLRKKGQEDTPWYTIEVDKDDFVVQIHGKCNCWCAHEGTDHIQYLIDYFNARNIYCSKKILLETAKGYGSSGNLVEDTFVW